MWTTASASKSTMKGDSSLNLAPSFRTCFSSPTVMPNRAAAMPVGATVIAAAEAAAGASSFAGLVAAGYAGWSDVTDSGCGDEQAPPRSASITTIAHTRSLIICILSCSGLRYFSVGVIRLI